MRIAVKTTGATLVAILLLGLSAASAHAAPFTMTVDNAILDLGGLSGVRAIDPTLEPPDPPATLSGDLTGNAVDIPKEGFVFPPKEAAISEVITATINMEANDDITGTMDALSGRLVLNASLKASVSVLGSDCVISPIVLELDSDNAHPYLGQAFTAGIEGDGVISGSWTNLPPVVGGPSCAIVSQMIGGAGGIAMSHGVHDFQTCETEPSNPLCDVVFPPDKAPVLNSAPSSSTDQTTASFTYTKGNNETQPVEGFVCSLDGGAEEPCGSGESGSKEYTGLAVGEHVFSVKATNSAGAGPATTHTWTVKESEGCPTGTTGTPPDCHEDGGKAKLGALKIKPKSKVLKRGKKVVVKVNVKNVGDAAIAGAKVCVTAPKRLIQVKKCVNLGQVAAGKTKVAKFKVKAKRKKGKAVLKFKATSKNAGSKSGKATVKVK